MKAKQYCVKLFACQDQDEFCNTFEEILYDLVKETEELIKTRNCKARNAIASCILDVDNKYKSIVRRYISYRDSLPEDHYMKDIQLLDDGFKAIYVTLHKEHSFAFDVDTHIKKIKEEEKRKEQAIQGMSNPMLHKLTPFEELTMENLPKEILSALASLGSFSDFAREFNIPIESARPLAQRIHLLRYWMSIGKINLDDAKEFEADPDGWCQNHNNYL